MSDKSSRDYRRGKRDGFLGDPPTPPMFSPGSYNRGYQRGHQRGPDWGEGSDPLNGCCLSVLVLTSTAGVVGYVAFRSLSIWACW
jgi:hypothetical protein